MTDTRKEKAIWYRFSFDSGEELINYLRSRGIDMQEELAGVFKEKWTYSGFFDVGDDFTEIFVETIRRVAELMRLKHAASSNYAIMDCKELAAAFIAGDDEVRQKIAECVWSRGFPDSYQIRYDLERMQPGSATKFASLMIQIEKEFHDRIRDEKYEKIQKQYERTLKQEQQKRLF